MFRGGRNCIIGMFAIAMGAGILIAAIFPTGMLMFLVATLLIASGCACWCDKNVAAASASTSTMIHGSVFSGLRLSVMTTRMMPRMVTE